MALADYNDIFGNTQITLSNNTVTVSEIAISELHSPDCHPFQVNDDEAMNQLIESIQKYGVQEPGLARPAPNGGYELLCGNRRKRACEIAGIATMPVIVRDLDDDLAVIAMVDSNLQQREKILPSEKAWAYKMRLDAMNHRGVKSDRRSCDIMAEQIGECKTKLFKIIRLTELIDALLDKVDSRNLAFSPAVELSYLSYEEQRVVANCMDKYAMKPSLSQTVRLKKMKQDGTLNEVTIEGVLSEEKKPPRTTPTSGAHYRKFFPPEYSPKQIEAVIVALLKNWSAT
jgi:ParB family chromosome partitioning protein